MLGSSSTFGTIKAIPWQSSRERYRPLAESGFFATGGTSQLPVPGTIARGELRESLTFYSGRNFFGYVANPLDVTEEVLARGKDRFEIFCTPCHGAAGDGRGALYQRSGVESANLLDERIVEMADGRLFEIATNGQGLMQGYRFPVSARDRWAIIAYVRQLQDYH